MWSQRRGTGSLFQLRVVLGTSALEGTHCEPGSHQGEEEEQINAARGLQHTAPVWWGQFGKGGPFSLWASTCDNCPWSLSKLPMQDKLSLLRMHIACSPYRTMLSMKAKCISTFKELRTGLDLWQVSVQEVSGIVITIIMNLLGCIPVSFTTLYVP